LIKPVREASLPGQESVWDFPRPSIAQSIRNNIRIIFAGQLIAETNKAVRTIETSHPPSYYFPPEDVEMKYLKPIGRKTFCEWKGDASYFDVIIGDRTAISAAWCYRNPTSDFRSLQDFIAFYPGLMDECFVDNERVTPQPGKFYGGWITSKFSGPFKGEPGTEFW
jgi:uncharacterized protein (DUF427 family)